MQLQALLFDLDGTLADTEGRGHRPAYNAAFSQLGLPWTWGPKLYRKLLAQPGGRERVRHYAETYRGEDHDPDDLDELVDAVHTAKSAHYRQRLADGRVVLRPGVRRLLKAARDAGIKTAIVTNASQASVDAFLEHALGDSLAGTLDTIVSPGDGIAKKPAPDLYLAALQRLGVDAGRCVAIEDSAPGVEAACAAGIVTVVTQNRQTREPRFPGAVLVLENLGSARKPGRVLRGADSDEMRVELRDLDALLTPPRP